MVSLVAITFPLHLKKLFIICPGKYGSESSLDSLALSYSDA